ncbi:MAG: hypothetical protein GYB53_18575 [Rhodobacteraceae bacterium]|uniref:hypothetical protein n=1 Tax=Oceanicola sp. S124 TaxID=1042378 RepID=UPI0002557A51|nr:hypothetical protein [Oceanicola sp. S124]MBR9765465.1 hypothetical protein [Paracoccaceae bacterium]MBR9819696.1 hypothetical protein [Paracoccaceae bacterium]
MNYQLKDRSFQTGDEWVGALAGRLRVAAAAGEDGMVCLNTMMSPAQARQAASRLDRMTAAEAEAVAAREASDARMRAMAEPVRRRTGLAALAARWWR